MPIITYHELLSAAKIKPKPKIIEGVLKGKKELVHAGYPFEEFYVFHIQKEGRITTHAIQFKFRGFNYHMKFEENLDISVGPTVMGWQHPYGSRHRINLMALYGLKNILSKTLEKDTNVKVKWLDGKWYNGKIDSFDEDEKKYKVNFPDGTFDFIDGKNIKILSLKF